MILMELIESVAWVALGFIPTLGGLEVASRLGFRMRKIVSIGGIAPALGGYPSLGGKEGKEMMSRV